MPQRVTRTPASTTHPHSAQAIVIPSIVITVDGTSRYGPGLLVLGAKSFINRERWAGTGSWIPAHGGQLAGWVPWTTVPTCSILIAELEHVVPVKGIWVGVVLFGG